MTSIRFLGHFILYTAIWMASTQAAQAQIVPVGEGSYTTVFPGVDVAGRNGYPSGEPQLIGNAANRPFPTNDWWSAVVKNDHCDNLFNYPMAMKTINQGLVVSYIVPVSTPNGSSQPIDDFLPIVVGVEGLSANRANVSNFSDWTVTMNWSSGPHSFEATTGIAMPFVYFTKASENNARIEINGGSVQIMNEMIIISDAHQGADFAIYGPTGSVWNQNGNVYTSDLNGNDYWSIAFLQEEGNEVQALAELYKKYAYVFPTNTSTTWNFDENNARLTTQFTVDTEVKEGSETHVLLGLLPHQWANLAPTSPQPEEYSFSSIRGEIKTLDGNSFSTVNTFHGILPTLPYIHQYSQGFDPAALDEKILQIENEGLPTWTDSYNEGQMMNRMIQTARIAHEIGDFEARDKMIATIKERLEDWLTAEMGEVAFIYYYHSPWTALLGYPAGHGQDVNINDHHFHWGYFIHSAAFLEQFEPGWSSEWGEMINLLIRDAASPNREDPLFPFLRNFSPYAGHSWANGFATFPFGNDQESTSESMQFASSLIHWGSVTNNPEIRDLGIFIYTTEQSAVEEYWFDMHQRTFKPGYGYSLASRIWGNGYDNQTFWTSDIAAAYGIEMYPIHGGSLYLGHHPTYTSLLWDEITANTGILSNEENPNLWHDTYWKYLSFIDPATAIDLYESYPERALKFGISDAQTYYWLHGMNALGRVNTNITADYPIAACFIQDEETIYVAHNYLDESLSVSFSDGYILNVPPGKMATSIDLAVSGTLHSSFSQAFPGGSVDLVVDTEGDGITQVEFYDNGSLIFTATEEPYQTTASNLALGIHGMYAKVVSGSSSVFTNVLSIQVGEQSAFGQAPFSLPGSIEAGNYDQFEGGRGQHVAYFDASAFNEGDYRPNEFVDAVLNDTEGPIVGWINDGEWMEYSIDVQTAGNYNVELRYACGNTSGGGPMHFEIDGVATGSQISFPYTGDWNAWNTLTVSGIELTESEHILKVAVDRGEFNLGRMEFSYESPLDFVPPVAHAGENVSVISPESTAMLDGSGSFHPDGMEITYLWEQVYGPSVFTISDPTLISPEISDLVQGVYKCKLTVSDGMYEAVDHVLIMVSETGNFIPAVSLTSPEPEANYTENSTVPISAIAADLDGTIEIVEFFDGTQKIGEDETAPYGMSWENPSLGEHVIYAIATDDGGAQGISPTVSIHVSQVFGCSETSNEAQQGSFSIGYTATFETVGTDVTISFEMLDTDKEGVIAYLWKPDPFTEIPMNNVSDLLFSKTLSGFTPGETITYACKFAFAGGLAVTTYIDYEVGDDCSTVGIAFTQDYQKIRLYPNPASNELQLRGIDHQIIEKIEIISNLGEVVLRQIRPTQSSVNVSELPGGVYIVNIYVKNQRISKTVVIQ